MNGKEVVANLFEISSHPIKDVLSVLLKDQTTGKNIIFATDAYDGKDPTDHIQEEMFLSDNPVVIQPRSFKSLQEQQKRTRHMAEVFTPTWLCNRMNNYLDEQWFGRADVFNRELPDNKWETVEGDIAFPEGRSWHDYINSKRIEIACGEAPYLVSRYDTTSGDSVLPLSRRIGLLDRKLRIVGERTRTAKNMDYMGCKGNPELLRLRVPGGQPPHRTHQRPALVLRIPCRSLEHDAFGRRHPTCRRDCKLEPLADGRFH